jgi:hypothetical protein
MAMAIFLRFEGGYILADSFRNAARDEIVWVVLRTKVS